MRRPGKPGPISTGGRITYSEIPDAPPASSTPVIFQVDDGGGTPTTTGEKPGDIAVDIGVLAIWIVDGGGSWALIYS